MFQTNTPGVASSDLLKNRVSFLYFAYIEVQEHAKKNTLRNILRRSFTGCFTRQKNIEPINNHVENYPKLATNKKPLFSSSNWLNKESPDSSPSTEGMRVNNETQLNYDGELRTNQNRLQARGTRKFSMNRPVDTTSTKIIQMRPRHSTATAVNESSYRSSDLHWKILEPDWRYPSLQRINSGEELSTAAESGIGTPTVQRNTHACQLNNSSPPGFNSFFDSLHFSQTDDTPVRDLRRRMTSPRLDLHCTSREQAPIGWMPKSTSTPLQTYYTNWIMSVYLRYIHAIDCFKIKVTFRL